MNGVYAEGRLLLGTTFGKPAVDLSHVQMSHALARLLWYIDPLQRTVVLMREAIMGEETDAWHTDARSIT